MFDIFALAQGFALGLGMFVCPGPKDVLILRQALLRHPAAELIAVGALSDAFLIWLGIAGVSAALSRVPALQSAALWLGVCLMAGHGLLSARRALGGGADVAILARNQPAHARSKSLAAVLMVSFLNPIAWFDTVLVIGSVGAALPRTLQLSFALGAIFASLTWFLVLVIGARTASGWITDRKIWRVLEGCVALTMIGLALHVACGLLG